MVCMDPQYFNFPTFSNNFVRRECRLVRSRWLPAPHALLLRYIRDAARVGFTPRTRRALWVMHRKRGEVNGNMCVKMET